MLDYKNIFSISPFSLNEKEKEKWYFDNQKKLTNYHYKNCKEYKKITNQKCLFQDIRLVIPQPVTLTKDDINPYNPDTILFKYAVTEKADGERYILLPKP